jgi:carbon starvation protein
LDSATRLLRFNVEEIFRSMKLEPLANRYFASLIAVGGIALFAQPQGAALWVLFGTTNQLLAGLTLLTVSLFLFKLRRPIIYTIIPMGMMLVMTAWAMSFQLREFYVKKEWLLFGVSVVVIVMTTWLVFEAILSFCRGRGGLSIAYDDEEPHDDQAEVAAATHLG